MQKEKIVVKVAKVGLLGDQTVGKTSICQTYAGKDFNESNLLTIGFDKYESKFKVEDGKIIKLIIWDTAGQERFHSLALNTIKAVNGIVLVADLTKKSSFENIKVWVKDIQENFDNPSLVLFGNKADLKDKWEVTTEEAKKYAEDNKLVYFETSAKTKQGIFEGFSYIANQTYKRAKQKMNQNIVLGIDAPKKPESGCCLSKKKEDKKNSNEKEKEKENKNK